MAQPQRPALKLRGVSAPNVLVRTTPIVLDVGRRPAAELSSALLPDITNPTRNYTRVSWEARGAVRVCASILNLFFQQNPFQFPC